MAEEATAAESTATETPAVTTPPASVLAEAATAVATEAKATETKTEAGAEAETSKATAGDKGAETKDGKAADAPVQYTDFTFPEGAEIDDATLGEAKTMLGEMRLPQDQAQKLVDFYANKVKAFGEAQGSNWVKLNDKWVSDFKADKEIGGDNVKATVDASKQAIAKFGTPELINALNMTGAGNHPEVIRFFARVGKATGSDTFVVASGASANANKSAAEVLYPDHSKAG